MVPVVGVFCVLLRPPLDRRTGAAPSWRSSQPSGPRPGLCGNHRNHGDAGGGRRHNHVTALMNTRMNTERTETANQNQIWFVTRSIEGDWRIVSANSKDKVNSASGTVYVPFLLRSYYVTEKCAMFSLENSVSGTVCIPFHYSLERCSWVVL